jgi:hypothetical protein
MSRAGPKFTDAQRETVYRLKCEGKSGQSIADLCAAGVGDERPFKISPQYANELAAKIKREREGLTMSPLALGKTSDAVRTLTQRAISIAERKLDALAREDPRTVDSAELAKVTRSLRELQQLSSKLPDQPSQPAPAPSNGDEPEPETPRSFLDELRDDHESAPPAIGDVRLNKARRAAAVDPELSEAKHASSEPESTPRSQPSSDEQEDESARAGIQTPNAKQSDELPEPVRRVLERRAALSS